MKPLEPMSATLELTQELIARRSVTPADAGCQGVIACRLEAAGFTIERLRYGAVDNLWARRGTSGPVVCFAGHTDVVPTGPLQEWQSDPFVPSVRDGVLYGRGAADMKSGIAAMVTAVEEFTREHPSHKGSIAFLITSDEEGAAVDGTKRVMETLAARNESIDWCVIGEPSSEKRVGDTIKLGRRGSVDVRLTVQGVQGHTAYPQLAVNPIHTLVPVLAELISREWDKGTNHFQPTAFQISNFNAGTGAPNVIPGELEVRFNLRYSPVQTLEGLKETMQGILCKHGVKFTIEWRSLGEPFYTPPGLFPQAVSEAVAEVTGSPPKYSTVGGTSDGRFIAPRGVQVVELGVVNASIHKVNECVRVAEIDALHRMYVNTLRNSLTK